MRTVHRVPGMDRQYTLCVLVPAHQYRNYVDNYHHQQAQQEQQRKNLQRPTYLQYQQQQQQEQIYENVVSQYRMRMCYHNDYENDEQIQKFYWEQCYKRDDADATAYYYCEYVRIHLGKNYIFRSILLLNIAFFLRFNMEVRVVSPWVNMQRFSLLREMLCKILSPKR